MHYSSHYTLPISFAANKKTPAHLGRTLPGDGLPQFAQEGDGGFGAGYQDCFLLSIQVQSVCEQKSAQLKGRLEGTAKS